MHPIASNPNESPIPVWGLALMIAGPLAALVIAFFFLKIQRALRIADLWIFAWFKRRRR